MTKSRGMLTPEVIGAAGDTLGGPITTEELRLFPFVHYTAVNRGVVSTHALSIGEQMVLNRWEAMGLCTYDMVNGRLSISKTLYGCINRVMWVAYVEGYDDEAPD